MKKVKQISIAPRRKALPSASAASCTRRCAVWWLWRDAWRTCQCSPAHLVKEMKRKRCFVSSSPRLDIINNLRSQISFTRAVWAWRQHTCMFLRWSTRREPTSRTSKPRSKRPQTGDWTFLLWGNITQFLGLSKQLLRFGSPLSSLLKLKRENSN